MTDIASIIQRPGYRREDLTKENQEILSWCDSLIEELDNLKNNLEFLEDSDLPLSADDEDVSVIGKMKLEIVINTIDKAVEWLQAHVDEIQVGLAENQDE